MPSRRILETSGFIIVAASLHVALAAVVLSDGSAPGALSATPVAAVAAGSGELQEMIAGWDAPPIAEETPEFSQPEAPQETEVEPPVTDEQPAVAALPVPAPVSVAPEVSPVRPNLPEPPEPQPVVAEPELPELQNFSPPEIKVDPALVLTASEHPQRRPDKPKPEPETRRKAEPTPEPARQQQAQPQQSRAASGGGGGGSGTSAAQQASLESQWASQLVSCISRRARAPSSIRQSGQVTLRLQISRNGTVQGVSLSASSGVAALDQVAIRAAQGVGRCPAAPAELTKASYLFSLPIHLQRR